MTVGSPPFGFDGPDLAFVRLPFEIEGRLAATNAYFNLVERARQEAVGGTRAPTRLIFVTGTISELSRSRGLIGNSSRIEHAAITGVGIIDKV